MPRELKNLSFCEITEWWNWNYLRDQISTHFFYYPVQLMIEKGFDVEVLAMLYPERKEVVHEQYDKLQVHRFARDKRVLSIDLSFFKYMMKKQYSLIYLHSISWLVNNVPWIVSRIKNTPMIFTTHSHDTLKPLLESVSEMSFVRKTILKNVLLLRDSPTCVFIAFTQCQGDSYRMLGIRNVRVIPHGVESRAFKVERDSKIGEKYGLGEFNILCVGTMEPRKGQILLVKSMPRVLKEFPNTKLLLLGRSYTSYQKAYLELLKSIVEKLGVKDKVVFLVDVHRSDLIQLYLLSTLFVLPTDAEMFGLVFLEAMAAGLPIVSTDKPQIREIVGDNEAGILVEREQTAIENAILHLLANSSIRRRLGSNGIKKVEQKYQLEKVIKQHWDLYQSLLYK